MKFKYKKIRYDNFNYNFYFFKNKMFNIQIYKYDYNDGCHMSLEYFTFCQNFSIKKFVKTTHFNIEPKQTSIRYYENNNFIGKQDLHSPIKTNQMTMSSFIRGIKLKVFK